MVDNFHRRCESALTHPVTLAAVAVLLVNDLVLKALWPHPWTTGKLSDLAWMVFAPPLVAYLLSFAARDNLRARCAASGIAYLGLPLLYAAFNTFAPLHDVIMGGFSLVTGSTNSSPLDPWDSVVIPFAMAIALWVWRRGPVAPGGLRSRLGMVAAGLAAFATVATSPNPVVQGITRVAVSSDVAIAGVNEGFGDNTKFYESEDGGFTWRLVSSEQDRKLGEIQPEIGTPPWAALETPRGSYGIRGSDIVISDSSGESVAYSTAHLRHSNNEWLQARESKGWFGRVLTFEPRDITYDHRSRNLIVAMGLQGVVVGTPGGEWVPVAVGEFLPVESLSPTQKTRHLASSYQFWIAVLTFPMSMLTLAYFLAYYFLRDPTGSPAYVISRAAWIAMLLLIGVSLALLATVSFDPERLDPQQQGMLLEMMGVLKFLAAFIVIVVGIAYPVTTRNRLRIPKFWPTTVSYLVMVSFVGLSFLAWLLLGISAVLAVLASVLLCSMAAFTLSCYLLRIRQQSATRGDTPES